MGQIVVDAIESEVDGVFALVVHANTHEDLYPQGLTFICCGIGLLAHVHLLELVNKAVRLVNLTEVDILRSA